MRKYFRKKPKQPTVTLKTADEIAIMREAGRLVAETFEQIKPLVKPGARLVDIDQAASAYLISKGAKPLYKGYRGSPPTQPPFPGVICASVNNEICHGIPDARTLKSGDIIGIDIGLLYKEFCGDACVTFPVGTIAPETQRLLDVSEASLYKGIEAAQVGARLTDIGAAIEEYVSANGFSVVREWGGHGIGRLLHEGLSVPHHGPAGRGPRLRPGMVFTIEPMVNAGHHEWVLLDDGWTVETYDQSLSSQFEHTIAITKNGPEILSAL